MSRIGGGRTTTGGLSTLRGRDFLLYFVTDGVKTIRVPYDVRRQGTLVGRFRLSGPSGGPLNPVCPAALGPTTYWAGRGWRRWGRWCRRATGKAGTGGQAARFEVRSLAVPLQRKYPRKQGNVKRVITGLAVAAVLVLSASACGSSGDGNPIEDEAAADTTTTTEERDTTTTEEPTTEAPTTTTPEPEPSCDELYDEWLAEPVDSPRENEIEAQMADQSCDQLPVPSVPSEAPPPPPTTTQRHPHLRRLHRRLRRLRQVIATRRYDPCVPIASDVDCAGGSGNGPAFTGTVRSIGFDEYGLDDDGDGVGCEAS